MCILLFPCPSSSASNTGPVLSTYIVHLPPDDLPAIRTETPLSQLVRQETRKSSCKYVNGRTQSNSFTFPTQEEMFTISIWLFYLWREGEELFFGGVKSSSLRFTFPPLSNRGVDEERNLFSPSSNGHPEIESCIWNDINHPKRLLRPPNNSHSAGVAKQID